MSRTRVHGVVRACSGGRCWLISGALGAALGVALGAAGMHGLRPLLAVNDPAGWFFTALHYHQLHALGLLLVGVMAQRTPSRHWLAVGSLFLFGLLAFSGNLYVRAVFGIHALHAVTPLGGMAWILGWLWFALAVWRLDRMPPGQGGGIEAS